VSSESTAMVESAVVLGSAVAVFAAILGIVMVEFIVFIVIQPSLM
jgi:hypothetical protein